MTDIPSKPHLHVSVHDLTLAHDVELVQVTDFTSNNARTVENTNDCAP